MLASLDGLLLKSIVMPHMINDSKWSRATEQHLVNLREAFVVLR